MDVSSIDAIMAHADKGRRIMLKSHKNVVKIKYGPFGLFTRRYYLDFESFHEIRNRLRYS